MKNFITTLAVSLACTAQPAVKQTPIMEIAQPQTDLSEPNETGLSQDEAKIIVILAQTNVEARKMLEESSQLFEELTAPCEVEDIGLFVDERKCTMAKIKAVQTQFCEWDKNLAASILQLETHHPPLSAKTRLLLKNLKTITDEIRLKWEDFLRKHLQSDC